MICSSIDWPFSCYTKSKRDRPKNRGHRDPSKGRGGRKDEESISIFYGDELGESKTWTFNLDTDALTPGGANIDPGDIINKAALRIKFTDDNDPSNAPFEYAKLILDGSTYYSDFEVDEGWLSNINVVTKFSPSDHILAVTITQNSGDFGVDKLEIHGCYTAVPEPMSLMLLGLGLLGIGVARRKN
jgi:hypothetical protein